MKVEAINIAGGAASPLTVAADRVSETRKKKENVAQDAAAAEKNNQIQPEELLEEIKGLTQDGVFSVRFERDDMAKDLVVKIVDRETDEVIRQVPAKEILELRAVLEDLRGNMVDTQV